MNKAYTQPGKDNIMEIIKLESDSEDAQTVEKNTNSEIQNQKQEIINLDENVENTKSNSQSSISTSASRGNLPLNKPNIQVKNESNNSSLFTISQRTKRILERINEKNKKAKLLNQFNQNKENENNIDKNVFIGRKTRSKEPNSADKKVKEKKIKLSMKTKEVIKKLKDIRNNRFDNINNDESKKPTIRKSSFSNLHIKYETLLQPSRELRLPISYKKILDSFIVLDRTLNRSKLSTNKSYNNFGNIKNLIESYTHRNFTIETLKQILYIVPHFYIMKYINVNNLNISTLFSMNGKTDKNHDLMIDIPNDFNERINKNYPKNFNFLDINFYKDESTYQPLVGNLNEKELTQRKNIFTNILNHIVNDFHNKFLKEKKIKIKFNPLIQKTWHHDFNPDIQCTPIPQFDIPEPPECKSIFEQTINNNDIKKQLNLINDKEKNDIIQPTKGKQSPANKFVSQELLQKIRAKEREKKIINEISDYNLYHNLQTDKIKVFKYLLLQIKTLLMTHNKSMELNELSELILNSNIMFKDFFEEKQKLNQEIIKFCQRNKGFININKHSTLGLMVVLENSDFVISDNLANIKI
jgi:hypothetical protein